MLYQKFSFISYISLQKLFYTRKQLIRSNLYIYIYVIMLNLYYIGRLFINPHFSIRVNSYIHVKYTKSLTIQRSPMAHRRWSQEQYVIKTYHWLTSFKLELTYYWLNVIFSSLVYFTNFYQNACLNLTMPVLLLKNTNSYVMTYFVLYF